MQYIRAYKFVFGSPKSTANILWASLCLISTAFIPVVGEIVLLGYLYEIIEFLHRRRQDDVYPDFTVDRFGKYLLRGAWSYLVQFIVQLPILVLLMAYCVVFLFVLFANDFQIDAGLAIILMIFFLLLFVVGFVIGLVSLVLGLKAGLSQEFKGALSMQFFKEFFGKVGKELILAELFLIVTGIPLVLIGYLCCFIGAFPALALIFFAQSHLEYQLYELYLERGGTPITLKEEDLPEVEWGE